MGDAIEGIAPGDPRYGADAVKSSLTPEEMDNLFAEQTYGLGRILRPARDNFLGWLKGNHDDTVGRRWHFHPIRNLLHFLYGDPTESEWQPTLFLGYSGIIRLIVSRGDNHSTREFNIFVHHGWGGARTTGAALNKLSSFARDFPDNSLYLMGHVHDRAIKIDAPLSIRERTDALIDRPRAFGVTGTFKKTYQQGSCSYAERLAYPPTALGVVTFEVHPWGCDTAANVAGYMSFDGMPLTKRTT